jgi:hypothetical protein
MNDEEAVLLQVRTDHGCGGDNGFGGVETGVAALADVPVATLSVALAGLLTGAPGARWVLAPDESAMAWPGHATLRELGVLDGTRVVLRRATPGTVSGARS